jgi:hypothetical protein
LIDSVVPRLKTIVDASGAPRNAAIFARAPSYSSVDSSASW